jgi:uncharacterized membrane protein
MAWIGLLLGALIGLSFAGFRAAVVGAAIGLVVGEVLRKARLPAAVSDASLAQRLADIEKRLTSLEANRADSDVGAAARGTLLPPSPLAPEELQVVPTPAAPVDTPVVKPSAEAVEASSVRPTPPLPVRKGGSGLAAKPARGSASVDVAAPATSDRLWHWFTGGNAMVRVGVVVLFFGIAFLLSYFAEHFTLPVEVKFAGVALIGAAMIGVGARLSLTRRAYAMALIGGGLGVLYLTVFAALEMVPLLAPSVAFGLLAAVAGLAAILALRFDAQALAALAAFGGLLAPALVQTDASAPILFGYVAVVNASLLAIAWRRSWRVLNLVGFVFTFLLGLWWGFEFYRPEYFASVEPFLVLFFAAYVAVPVANALFAPAAADRRLDAMLVFGVPIVAFALQAALVRGSSNGLAWSAATVAAVYALLWIALKRRSEPQIQPLAAAHGALALVFATLVVPLAVDPRWTSAIWAVEAAGVYWNACRQHSRLGRAFALLLQLGTGIAFILGGFIGDSETPFANREFLGIAAIALSGFATSLVADRDARLPPGERMLSPLVFTWAFAWWLVGGSLEAGRQVAARYEAHAMLAWVVFSIAAAVALARPLRWPRLDSAAVALLPAIALGIGHDLWRRHTGMLAFGWAIYPVAWVLHFVVLHRAEARAAEAQSPPIDRSRLKQWLVLAHAFGALLLLGQLSWEAGEWTARVTPLGTAWAACAHLIPLALCLLAVAFAAHRERWPVRTFAEAYAGVAGALVAVTLGVGFAALAILHPGDVSPLPYVPLLNPLEITLMISLGAIIVWAQLRAGRASIQVWVAAGAFVILNGAVARAVHHWLDVPWRFASLAASKPLQAALTLTWSAAALVLMITGNRRGARWLWLTGAGLLAAAVIKLFVVDLAALAGLTRVVAFLGVGALLLLIGYVTPLPPADAMPVAEAETREETGDHPHEAGPLI